MGTAEPVSYEPRVAKLEDDVRVLMTLTSKHDERLEANARRDSEFYRHVIAPLQADLKRMTEHVDHKLDAVNERVAALRVRVGYIAGGAAAVAGLFGALAGSLIGIFAAAGG